MDLQATLPRLLIASVLIVFESAIVACFAEAVKIKCSHVDEFYSASPESHCRSFYRCTNRGVREVKECDVGALFDFSKQTCTRSSIDCPELSCIGRDDGVYADVTHACRRAFTCHASRLQSIDHCPSKQLHNGQKCVPQHLVPECVAVAGRLTIVDDGICRGRPDGDYKDPSSADCRLYVACSDGQLAARKRCNSQARFDGKSCVPSVFYQCPTAAAGQDDSPNEQCSGRSGLCASPDGDAFCHSRPDGYYKDPATNDGCRTYHYCSNGYKITYLCEPGYYFDEQTLQCVRLEASQQLHCRASSPCYGKSIGYHADLRSNCRSYFYCNHDEKLTQLTCRDNVFDGQKCVPPSQYACQSLYNYRQINCIPRRCAEQCRHKDGFFIDLKSDCRDYFSCIGGKRSRLSCPSGKRFNGEICVAEDKFHCPVFCTSKSSVQASCPSLYIDSAT